MVRLVNRLIINSLILFFIAVLAFVYYDMAKKDDLVLLDTNTPKALASNTNNQAQEFVQAGTIKKLQGKVSIKSAAGKTTVLASGDSISVGDIIQTGKQAKTNIQFSDQSQITLYEDTQLKIIDYSFVEGAAGKNIAQLLRGQLRVVSGLIGKRKGDNYQMRSHVATIGIRGTEYILRFCYKDECKAGSESVQAGLYMGVIDGEIVASSDSGDTIIKKGELFHQLRKDKPAEQISLIPDLLEDGQLIAKVKPEDKRKWILEKVK